MIIFVGACNCLKKSSTGTNIEEVQELHQSLADIGNWRGLCENLKVPDSVMELLKHNGLSVEHNKRECLQAYFNSGTATWEEVREAVAAYPIINNVVADKIEEKYLMVS